VAVVVMVEEEEQEEDCAEVLCRLFGEPEPRPEEVVMPAQEAEEDAEVLCPQSSEPTKEEEEVVMPAAAQQQQQQQQQQQEAVAAVLEPAAKLPLSRLPFLPVYSPDMRVPRILRFDENARDVRRVRRHMERGETRETVPAIGKMLDLRHSSGRVIKGIRDGNPDERFLLITAPYAPIHAFGKWLREVGVYQPFSSLLTHIRVRFDSE
jgi:hypothetical protein